MPPSVLVDLVYLDDAAVRIVKENLVPAVHRTLAPVRIEDAICLKMRLEGCDVVAAVGEMPRTSSTPIMTPFNSTAMEVRRKLRRRLSFWPLHGRGTSLDSALQPTVVSRALALGCQRYRTSPSEDIKTQIDDVNF